MSSGASSSGTRGGGDRSKGKGRAGHHGGRMGRPRRAADYTPAVEPRANQAAIEEAARMAVERAGAAGLDDGDSDDQSSCYICAEPVKYWVLGTCSHRTCHVCSLRLRALYKKRECTFCKVTQFPSLRRSCTEVETDSGRLGRLTFQQWYVRRHSQHLFKTFPQTLSHTQTQSSVLPSRRAK